VVTTAIAHAMEATRGRRALYARYEGNPDSRESMYDVGAGGRSHVAEAKANAEARGEYTFAKMDHLGIQARPDTLVRCPGGGRTGQAPICSCTG